MKSIKSRKAKGRKFQQWVRDRLKVKFPYLQEGDIESRGMAQQGTDIILTPTAKMDIPYDFECKNCEQWSIVSSWKQTVDNTEEGRKPLLTLKKNNHEPLVVMRFDDFLELL